MSGLRVLIIGGTGIISTAVVAEAVERGHEVHTLSRSGGDASLPSGVRAHRADVRDAASGVRPPPVGASAESANAATITRARSTAATEASATIVARRSLGAGCPGVCWLSVT